MSIGELSFAALGIDPQPWRDSAACVDYPTDMFYLEGGGGAGNSARERIRTARIVCGGCPVQTECLAWALEHNERFGIWGGLTEKQRAHLRRGAA